MRALLVSSLLFVMVISMTGMAFSPLSMVRY
jgi:hypothetical protein